MLSDKVLFKWAFSKKISLLIYNDKD